MSKITFILIPGAGGSAWYWHLVAPKLRQRGHEAVLFHFLRQTMARACLSMRPPF